MTAASCANQPTANAETKAVQQVVQLVNFVGLLEVQHKVAM